MYKYSYENEYAEKEGKSEDERDDTGVIAQELREVMPDAVKETGDIELSSGTIQGVLGVNKVSTTRARCVRCEFSLTMLSCRIASTWRTWAR